MDTKTEAINVLNNVNTLNLIINICNFLKLTPKNASREEMRKLFNTSIPDHLIAYQDINRPDFFRIRRNHDENPFENYDDFWHKKESIGMGRFNKINEPMLYLSLDPVIPFHEAHIKPGDNFTLIFYQYKNDKKISALLLEGMNIDKIDYLKNIGLSEKGLINHYIINNFIRSQIMRDVGEGTEYLYEITNMIKDFYDKDNIEQAFVYSSINNYHRTNCAIKPDFAKLFLKCTGCFFGKLTNYLDEGESIEIKPLKRCSHEITEDKKIVYDSFYGDGKVIIKMINTDNQ